jgi:hypothetical protein
VTIRVGAYPLILVPWGPPRWAGTWCARDVWRGGWQLCGGAIIKEEDGVMRCEDCRAPFGRWRRR